MTSDLHALSAAAAVQQLAKGRIGAEELTRACLARIAAREPEVGAFECLEPERALEQARRLDAAGRPGPLHGLPVGIKDLIDTADLPTAYGTALHRGHRPARDAACVAALRAAGAVILGKTVTTELAYFTPGKTRNPRDLLHTPGGSSSGSAAAVADEMVPAALGTQTAGSVIRPASFCGVFGFKPTHGALSTAGIKALAPSLDTLGILARELDDLALLARALGMRLDPPPLDRPPRIGFCRTAQWAQAEPATQDLLEDAAGVLAAAGARVEEVELGQELDGVFEVQKTLMAAEMAEQLAPERRAGEERLGEPLRKLFREGDLARPAAYPAALEQAARLRPLFDELAGPFDALLTPAAPGEAPVGLASTGDPVFNRIWTALHAPCLSLPLGHGPNHLPIGLQIVAARGRDARLFSAAAFVVEAMRADAR